METNRKKVFKVLIPILAAGTCAALLFGITGILADPAAPRPEPAKVVQQSVPSQPVAAPATGGTSDGGKVEETVAKAEEKEPFPQFDDEPSGS